MKTTIKTELENHILDKINDRIIDNTNKDEWHHYCFNEDYYIIGYYNANQWLKEHNLDTFEAIEIVKNYEIDNYGKFWTYINSESIVNMLAYIYGEEIIYGINAESIEELKENLE